MKLIPKINLACAAVLAAGIGVAAYYANDFLQDNARHEVMTQASLMMEAAASARTYTSEQIKPLLETEQHFTRHFVRQTVSAVAATEMFRYLRRRYPAYTYKEAALNPSNLDDRAVDWEADIINSFRNHPDKKQISGERDTPEGRSLFLAPPIRAAAPCLDCHSTPARAPISMLRQYGKENGFGWNLNEVVAAQIVSVPEAVPVAIAGTAFKELLIYFGAIGLGTLIVLDLALAFIVLRPVKRLARTADEISKGTLDAESIPVKGNDEIAGLGHALNRMYLSLRKAFQLLERGEGA